MITGSSSGFGRMAALELARAGYTVCATMRGTSERNRTVVDEFRSLAGNEAIDPRLLGKYRRKVRVETLWPDDKDDKRILKCLSNARGQRSGHNNGMATSR